MGRSARRADVPVGDLKRRFTALTVSVALGLFFGTLLFLEVGRQIGMYQLAMHGSGARAGLGVVDGAVYGLMALLVGFAFNGAAGRFDRRRQLVAAEAHAAAIAWQRVDVLPADRQPAIREAFRRYVDAVIAWYGAVPGVVRALDEPAEVTAAQRDTWLRSVAACVTKDGDVARMLLLPALNELFGAVEKERMARRIHPPMIIFAMLAVAGLATALFAGYGLAGSPGRQWLYMLGVAGTFAAATFVILELEFPRLGLVQIDAMDQALVELRATMG